MAVDTTIPALEFAQTARLLGAACHELGIPVPAFRAPPRKAECARTIRRHENGNVISVRIKDRPVGEWALDMVEGCIAAARLEADDAARARVALLEAVA